MLLNMRVQDICDKYQDIHDGGFPGSGGNSSEGPTLGDTSSGGQGQGSNPSSSIGYTDWAIENRATGVEFLNSISQIVMNDDARTGVPWQVTLAQAAYESGWGTRLPKDIDSDNPSNNLFGVKYFGDLKETEKYVRVWTREWIREDELSYWEKQQSKYSLEGEKLQVTGNKSENGKFEILVIQAFRKYASYEASIEDHSAVLSGETYADAREYSSNPYIYAAIIARKYATGESYIKTLVSIMDDYLRWEDKAADKEEYNQWVKRV